MTILQEKAVNMICRMPEEKLYYVAQLLENMKNATKTLIKGLGRSAGIP